ncbi:MAG: threonine/serine dehydratase [Rhodothalassiaceae bacterium]
MTGRRVNPSGDSLAVDAAAVEAAARRLAGIAVETPLLASDWLDRATGGRVLIKPECLQRTGSFKIRGAYNRLAQLSPEERKRGVVAFSSGNHAQGVAAAAERLGIPAVIVMPEDAPRQKLANTRALGAEVRTYPRHGARREEIAATIARERGMTLVPSFDDPHIIAGQGTVGREIAKAMQARDIEPQLVLAPVGGGGLLAGSAIALKAAFPGVALYGVEPAGWDDLARSLRLGERVPVDSTPPSLCDALLSPSTGVLTFPILHRFLEGALAVDDAAVKVAMRFAFERLKLVVEPGGAVALAALLCRAIDIRGQTAVIVLSGGNVDHDAFCRLTADTDQMR